MSSLAFAALAASAFCIAAGKEVRRGVLAVDASTSDADKGQGTFEDSDLSFRSDGSASEGGCAGVGGHSVEDTLFDWTFAFAPPPSFMKCVVATVVGSLFAIAGMVLERSGEQHCPPSTTSRTIAPEEPASAIGISVRQVGDEPSSTFSGETDAVGDRLLRPALSVGSNASNNVTVRIQGGQPDVTNRGARKKVTVLPPRPPATARAAETPLTCKPTQSEPSRPVIANVSLDASGPYHVATAESHGGRDSTVSASTPQVGARSYPVVKSGAAFGRTSPGGGSCDVRDGNDVERAVRQVKSVLNKLTRQNFDKLYAQLLECVVESKGSDEIILVVAQEVFAKATMEKSFVEMYADVCAKLSQDLKSQRDKNKVPFKSHATEKKDVDAANIQADVHADFRRALLEQCQKCFHFYLDPPNICRDLGYEEQYEQLVKFKTKMLGNVRLIGHLLKRNILSAKIVFLCAEELTSIASPEALETLCVFLGIIGPAFDAPEWQGYRRLDGVFRQIQELAEAPGQTTRIQCLVKDLLQQRKRRWQER